MSISGHKVYGPKGVGALIVQSQIRSQIQPLFFGGGQQYGLRSGTVSPFLVVGLAEAVKIATFEMDKDNFLLSNMSNLFLKSLANRTSIHLNGSMQNRLPNNLNIRFEMLASDLMVKTPNVAISIGSACLSIGGSIEPSHVLKALGLSDEEIKKSARISVGRFTNERDISLAVNYLLQTLTSNFSDLSR